jgi:hypothetical protein
MNIRIPTLCASAVVVLVLPFMAICQEGSAGFVEEIRGPVFLRQSAGAKAIRLDPKADVARRLYPGEQVRCDRRAILRLRLGRKIKNVGAGTGWFTIPRATRSRADALQRALDEYGRTGGRERGEPLQVFSPSAHSVVMPRLFVIRWIPGTAKCTVSLAIRETEGKDVWRQNDIDGSSGSLDSDAARQALTIYRAGVGQGPLLLRLADSCANETLVSFSLLSVKSEAALKEELAFWDKRTGSLMLHLGRAYVFDRYKIFPKAAEEYEAALKVAPQSRELLIRTILAHRSTGNFARREQLTKRLPPGTTIP